MMIYIASFFKNGLTVFGLPTVLFLAFSYLELRDTGRWFSYTAGFLWFMGVLVLGVIYAILTPGSQNPQTEAGVIFLTGALYSLGAFILYLALGIVLFVVSIFRPSR